MFGQKSSILDIDIQSIDYQNDESFISEVDGIIKLLLDRYSVKNKNYKDITSLFSKLSDVIYRRFGIRFRIVSLNAFGPMIIKTNPANLFVFGRDIDSATSASDHPTIQTVRELLSAIQSDVRKSNKAMLKSTYTVDTKNARIDGLPDKTVVGIINMPMGVFAHLAKDGKMNSRMITAILLHEVGHGFSYIQYNGSVSRRGSALTEIFKQYYKDPDKAKKKAIENIGEFTDDSDVISKIKNSKEEKTFWAYYASVVAESVLSLNKKVDFLDKEAEIVADQFASRFGLSKEMATALEAVYEAMGETSSSVINVNIIETTMLYAVFSNLLLFLGPIAGIPLTLGLIYVLSRLSFDTTYLAKIERTRLLLREFIGGINESKEISSKERKEILAAHNELISILESRNKVDKIITFLNPIKSVLYDVIDFDRARYNMSVKMDNLVYALASNELKISSLLIDEKLSS